MLYNKVLIKLSGEALAHEAQEGKIYDDAHCEKVAVQLLNLAQKGVKIGLVIGAGNIWRGRQGVDMNATVADHMGMLATVINALYMSEVIKRVAARMNSRIGCVVMTSFAMEAFVPMYTYRGAMKALDEGNIVIFAGGTGHPFFSTDTGAALRAIEIGAEALLCGKSIDYLYTSDPNAECKPGQPKPEPIFHTDYRTVIRKQYRLMDLPAVAMCMDHKLPILTFALADPENITRVMEGEKIGTVVDDQE